MCIQGTIASRTGTTYESKRREKKKRQETKRKQMHEIIDNLQQNGT